jgi:hypothetical protein
MVWRVYLECRSGMCALVGAVAVNRVSQVLSSAGTLLTRVHPGCRTLTLVVDTAFPQRIVAEFRYLDDPRGGLLSLLPLCSSGTKSTERLESPLRGSFDVGGAAWS